MKNKKLLALAASAALIANLALGIASAATTTSDQQLNGGTLAINSVPASVDFANINVSTASQINNATFPDDTIQIQDTRSVLAGYTFAMNATDFQETSNLSTLDVTNLEVLSNGSPTQIGSSDCVTGASSGLPITFADSDNDGTSDSSNIVTGDSRIRVMECHNNYVFRLTVPGSTSSGTYRSTITWSIS
jgi:hypothetical protein